MVYRDCFIKFFMQFHIYLYIFLIPVTIVILHSKSSIYICLDIFTLEQKLIQLQPFVFMPNHGNIGDALIAVSEISLFNRLKLNYTIYDGNVPKKDFNFVYGGGGVFIEGVWCCEKIIEHILTSKFLKQGIILSHSIRGCHNLLKLCEEKVIIFCREAKSYELAVKQSPAGRIFLDHDMSLYTGREWYDKEVSYTENDGLLNNEQMSEYDKYKEAYNRLENVLKTKTYKLGNRTVRFFLRGDKERIISNTFNVDSFDLSIVVSIPKFSKTAQIKIYTDLFISVLESTDIIVTDRLHVGIGTIKAGKMALIFDNSYGKISGVINQSLQKCKNIKLLHSLDEIVTNDLVKLKDTVIPKQFIKKNITDKKVFKCLYQYYSNPYNI